MKKTLSLVLALVMLVSMTGCFGGPSRQLTKYLEDNGYSLEEKLGTDSIPVTVTVEDNNFVVTARMRSEVKDEWIPQFQDSFENIANSMASIFSSLKDSEDLSDLESIRVRFVDKNDKVLFDEYRNIN